MKLHHIDTADNLPPHIVDDYFFKRHASHKNGQAAYDFTCNSDLMDVKEVMVLATDEKKCIGGLTITVSDQGYPLLPMEYRGFRLNDVFPCYDLPSNRYAEINNIYINPHQHSLQYNNKVLFDLLYFSFQHIYDLEDIRYVFISGIKAHLRLYHLMLEQLDFEPVEQVVDHIHSTKFTESIVLSVELPNINLLPSVQDVKRMLIGIHN